MASTSSATLRVLGQIGTMIALGLLFDTLIVQSFMTPSIAAPRASARLVAILCATGKFTA